MTVAEQRSVTNKNAKAEVNPDAVPMALWGKDHWSTFAYIETRCVDHEGVPNREHMRCTPKIHPGLTNSANQSFSTDYPTRLKGGIHEGKPLSVEKKDHDDWSCLEDAESAGLLINIGTGINPVFRLTDLGRKVADQLRLHKSNGGRFATFEPQL
jgi:hypothetical protein